MKTLPLLNKDFLNDLTKENQKEIFAKIVSLNLKEEPIESIEGIVTDGTINIDGTSAIRRSCSLSLIANDLNINDFYWGLTNKFKLYIGLANRINPDYEPIIWFPQGIYVITEFSVNYTTKQYTVKITGKDKMCLLNGDIGGSIPDMTNFAIFREEDDDGNWTDTPVPMSDLIREMLYHYGNELFSNIVIRDIDTAGLELLDYKGNNDIYFLRDTETGEYPTVIFEETEIRYRNGRPIQINDPSIIYYSLSPYADNSNATKITITARPTDFKTYNIIKCSREEAVGYRTTPLVWPDKDGLMACGDTVTSVLDKIVKTFGNYEYFYDVDGKFIFQKKLTYLDIAWNNIIKNEDNEEYCESSKLVSEYSYNFGDSILIQSFSNKPNFKDIKNDYCIWGRKKPITDNSEGKQIHVRYAIHEKPKTYTSYDGTIWATPAQEIKYDKKPLPPGLSNDWWDVEDWANFYKMYTGDFPTQQIGVYCTQGGDTIDLNNLFDIPSLAEYNEAYTNVSNTVSSIRVGAGKWYDDYETHQIYVFDVIETDEGLKVGYTGHGTNCTHEYKYFLKGQQNRVRSFIYKPLIPTVSLNHLAVDWREIIYQMASDYFQHYHEDDFLITIAKNNPQYPNGKTGYEQFYTDLFGFWRTLYNPEPEDDDRENYFLDGLNDKTAPYQNWNKNVFYNPSALEFWFDFLDAEGGELSKYSVNAIGDRSKVVNDDSIKSIIYNEVPTVIYITKEKLKELTDAGEKKDGYVYVILPESMEEFFSISTKGKNAQDELNNMIYQYGYVNESITLKTVPIYYLNPNTKITINDDSSKIFGEYIIDKMTIPLKYNSFMTINATKAPSRLY